MMRKLAVVSAWILVGCLLTGSVVFGAPAAVGPMRLGVKGQAIDDHITDAGRILERYEDISRRERRGETDSRVMVSFECPPGDAVCKNGGQGPAITYRKGHLPLCTCLCRKGYDSSQCDGKDSLGPRGPT